MKKILALLLAVVLVMSLAACGSTSSEEVKKPSDVSAIRDGEQKIPVASPEATVDANQPSTITEATIAETVLVDEQGVKITAKSLDAGALFGPELKLLIENNSGKNLTFQCRESSVNGYMVDTMMSVEVVDGKKANDELTFMDSDLEACGIKTIADMEFSFHIFTTEDWETYLDTEKIQIKTSAAEGYTYIFDDSGDLAYEGNGVKVVVKGLSKDTSIFGPSVVVYIENSGDEDVTVQTRDVSINGYMVNAMFSPEVGAGKRAVDTITFLSSELEENDITEVQDIELSFHIFTSKDWNTLVDTEVVAMSF